VLSTGSPYAPWLLSYSRGAITDHQGYIGYFVIRSRMVSTTTTFSAKTQYPRALDRLRSPSRRRTLESIEHEITRAKTPSAHRAPSDHLGLVSLIGKDQPRLEM
jgi:hypothetical protein